jgi:catechol 2,3-dioxygenase-like lactoylglutathione lyase family enzyme
VTAFGALKPVQLAYHVPDPEAAAERFAREFGWGPFFLMEHIPLERSLYRGRPEAFDHSSAYGQAGDLMVELITQHNEGPSALRDMYARDATGLHHVAYFVPDLQAAVDEFRGRGAAIALDARTATGVDFAMVDLSAALGHMLELYEPGEDLRRFYAHVRKSAEDWDGSRPLRRLRG